MYTWIQMSDFYLLFFKKKSESEYLNIVKEIQIQPYHRLGQSHNIDEQQTKIHAIYIVELISLSPIYKKRTAS